MGLCIDRCIIYLVAMEPTHAKVWNVDYFWTDCFNGRTCASLVDPDGGSDWCHVGTVGLTSTHSIQRAPAADGVTRGQTLET